MTDFSSPTSIGIYSSPPSAVSWFFTQQALKNPGQSWVWLTEDAESAYRSLRDVSFFAPPALQQKLELLPLPDALPFSGIATEPDTVAKTLRILNRLQQGEPLFIVTPFSNLLRPLPPPSLFVQTRRILRKGEEIRLEAFCRDLIEMGYEESVLVETEGAFARRGNILDLFSPANTEPVRIELEGDTIVSLRFFDPTRQTSQKKTESVLLLPAREIVLFESAVDLALKKLKETAKQRDIPGKNQREFAEHLKHRRYFRGIDTLLPYFYETPATLSDYLPKESRWIIQNELSIQQEDKKRKEQIKHLSLQGTSLETIIPAEQTELPWQKGLAGLSIEGLTTLSEKELFFIYPAGKVEKEIRHSFKLATQFKQPNLERWAEQLKVWKQEGVRIIITAHNSIQTERLKEILQWHEIPTQEADSYAEAILKENRQITLVVGSLSEGFLVPEEKLILLTEQDLFGQKRRKPVKKEKKGEHIDHLSHLSHGDILVHEEHGFGKFLEMKHLKFGHEEGDYLLIEYFGGDKLYLPVYRMNMVSRYAGSAEEAPYLDRMGGTRWKKARKKADQSVHKIAMELLKVHALRELKQGISFSSLNTLDEEFAAAFPYDETPDQEQAIGDVLRDMENKKPMDRLICGDVGYGKTEVAMRAAFKAVSNGCQVAILVPTTVLALQHFENFQERFQKQAVKIAMLSRFIKRSEQKEVLQELQKGAIDIVIGTHQLLQSSIQYKKLGLLVVDEEHRFGVKHKERIKQLKANVDVLTLSATPIPRTLHMSLSGLKDLSLIQTPPVDRMAVRTHIVPAEDGIIQHAIAKELERGGQIFFVHNRVATIESMHRRLSHLLPQASIGVAHGQMDEAELEQVMMNFLHQKIQILLTTTIIESGIDVPTANTIIIYRADTFGLAQLYQLRGRVGRSDRQAYCYLLVPDQELMTKDADRRLSALTRHTELGSGFQIASHDLEIRGAGNLLGTAQSGFVEEIGYELYTKLLNRTLRKLKGEVVEEEIDPEIKIPVPAFIPEDYVADSTLRMGLYKRLANIEKEEEIPSLEKELIDRFGPLPVPLQSLLQIIPIKLLAQSLRITQLHHQKSGFLLQFHETTPIKPEALVALVKKQPQEFQLKPPDKLICRTVQTDLLQGAREILKKLIDFI